MIYKAIIRKLQIKQHDILLRGRVLTRTLWMAKQFLVHY